MGVSAVSSSYRSGKCRTKSNARANPSFASLAADGAVLLRMRNDREFSTAGARPSCDTGQVNWSVRFIIFRCLMRFAGCHCHANADIPAITFKSIKRASHLFHEATISGVIFKFPDRLPVSACSRPFDEQNEEMSRHRYPNDISRRQSE